MKTTDRCHSSHMTICLYGATKDALNRVYDNSEVKTRRLRLAKKKPHNKTNQHPTPDQKLAAAPHRSGVDAALGGSSR